MYDKSLVTHHAHLHPHYQDLLGLSCPKPIRRARCICLEEAGLMLHVATRWHINYLFNVISMLEMRCDRSTLTKVKCHARMAEIWQAAFPM